MFRCSTCGVPTGPRVSPIRVVKETRDQIYSNMKTIVSETGGRDRHETVTSPGWEIAKELSLCPLCAGEDVIEQKEVDFKFWSAASVGRFAHAKKCDGTTSRTVKGQRTKEACEVCPAVKAFFASLPPAVLSVVLENPVPPRWGRSTMAAIAVENLIARSNHDSKRGRADYGEAMRVLGAYQKRGGTL